MVRWFIHKERRQRNVADTFQVDKAREMHPPFLLGAIEEEDRGDNRGTRIDVHGRQTD
jgi:hypothetical protein